MAGNAPYRHRTGRPLRLVAKLFRLLAKLLRQWPLLLLVAWAVSPITPHMRWRYTYQDYGQSRVYYHCQYIGVEGFIDYREGANCPFITLIDRS